MTGDIGREVEYGLARERVGLAAADLAKARRAYSIAQCGTDATEQALAGIWLVTAMEEHEEAHAAYRERAGESA